MTKEEKKKRLTELLEDASFSWEKKTPLYEGDRFHLTPYYKTPPRYLANAIIEFLEAEED